MPIRYRRSKKIAPGVRLNATHRGVGMSAGIPGTGLSYSTRRRGSQNNSCVGYIILAGIALVAAYWAWQFFISHWLWFALVAVVVAGVVYYRRQQT